MIGLVGGLGFIGRALASALRADGAAPVLMDRVGAADGEAAARGLGCRYRRLDLSKRASLRPAFEKCDTVVHLAWSSVPATAAVDPVADAQANVVGTVALLEAAREAGVGRVVFLSSGGTVYGSAGALPVREDRPLRPIGVYGAAKAAAEAYVSAFAQTTRVGATIVRLSNPYGPGQSSRRAQGAVAVFTRRILDGEPIELWGDGSTVRDYVHIEDAARALALLSDHRDEAPLSVYNVGSGIGVSTLDLVRMIERATGVTARLRQLEARSHDVPVSILNCSRIRERGWSPRIDLAAGLERVVAEMRNRT